MSLTKDKKDYSNCKESVTTDEKMLTRYVINKLTGKKTKTSQTNK